MHILHTVFTPFIIGDHLLYSHDLHIKLSGDGTKKIKILTTVRAKRVKIKAQCNNIILRDLMFS